MNSTSIQINNIKLFIQHFFEKLGLFNPLDFNDPVTYAIPGFFILIFAEIFFYLIPKKLFTKELIKDDFSSVGLGLGAAVLDFGMKAISISYFLWFYNHFRIFTVLGTDTIQQFTNLNWHKAHWWVWALVFIGQDFGFYWHHRLSHQIRILWAAHVNHHSATNLSYAIALRQGWLELLYRDIWYIPLAILGFHPLMIAMMHQINLIYQFWPHTTAVGKLGWFDKIFNSPSNHRVHHASNVKYLDKNYGGILIIWDRIFDTFIAEENKGEIKFGITTNISTYNIFRIAFGELGDIIKDVKRSPDFKTKLNYLFNAPGWSHDGEDLRSKTLQKRDS